MPTPQTLERFIARVEANAHVQAVEELAYQRWEGEKIAQEQFFYDPRQFVRKPAGGA